MIKQCQDLRRHVHLHVFQRVQMFPLCNHETQRSFLQVQSQKIKKLLNIACETTSGIWGTALGTIVTELERVQMHERRLVSKKTGRFHIYIYNYKRATYIETMQRKVPALEDSTQPWLLIQLNHFKIVAQIRLYQHRNRAIKYFIFQIYICFI